MARTAVQGVASALCAAGIVDVFEKIGQRSHLIGGQFHSRRSCSVTCVQEGAREQGAGIALQWLHKDPFGRLGRVAVTATNALITLGVAHILPVGRAVDRADKARRIDKGFQQQQGITKALHPVGLNPALAQGQYPRGQILMMAVGQNQKARIVGDQVEPVVLMTIIPANPAIADATLQGRGGKAQQGQPLALPGGDIPQGIADLGQCAQVMMGLHQLLVTGFF